jgi:peptidoglycan-N-acetylglucosamine deacetylase
MYLAKTPLFVQHLFPNYTWKIANSDKALYLTFDDGPVPEVTPLVLDMLQSYTAKATFFCVGQNIDQYPEVFERIVEEGHTVGSHTYHHLNGWHEDNIQYYHDVRHAARRSGSVLFRPPYGKLKPAQSQFLQRHYRIIMWDVLSGDFDKDTTKERCVKNVIQHAESGSIVVFHDSIKSAEKVLYALPLVLDYFSRLGFTFQPLETKIPVPLF